jgi:phosphatidate cytidylyltransferase
MALDKKKFGTRALSAIFFVAVLLSCTLFSYLSFTVFYLVVALWGLTEFYKMAKALGYRPYAPMGYFSASLLYLSFVSFPLLSNLTFFLAVPFEILAVLPFLVMISAVFDKHERPFSNALFTIGGIIYAVLPFALAHDLVSRNERNLLLFDPWILMGIIVLIWSNDTFAYLGGSFFGKHKMIERVSPGKTWEGTVIGILISFGLSFFIQPLLKSGTQQFWLFAGLIVPIMATLGDLLESVLKRQSGLKDSGNVLPGHGGILDRFDSLIFVTPFVWLVLRLIV